MKRCIAIVNRVQLRIFDADDLRRIFLLNHPDGREKNRAFTSGRPTLGRDRAASVSHTHNMSVERSPHDDMGRSFARTVASELSRNEFAKRFARILIVAEPRMSGWLRSEIGNGLKQRTDWLAKDLGNRSDAAVREFFATRLLPWTEEASAQFETT